MSSGDQRLELLMETGLSAAADPGFDRFAALTQRVLGVPVALVSLVEDERQIFPGACGLGQPWDDLRATPMSHSFCQHVVHSGEPLIVEDARTDPRVAGNLAIRDLNVVGYAGMPLTSADGQVLGSLCAIDTAPRRWTGGELSILADLAAACSDSLRLRIATWNAEHREGSAYEQSRQAAAASNRAALLLRAASALAATSTSADVVDAVRGLVTGTIDPAYVGLSLLDDRGRLVLQSGMTLPAKVAAEWALFETQARTPSAIATSTGSPIVLPDLTAVRALAPDATATFTEMGWQAAASVPLPGPDGPAGALTFVWKQPHQLDAAEQAVLAALGGYVAQAIQRADHLTARENVAAILQQALLSELPDSRPFDLAARYEPAARDEHVGGDWYDAVRLGPDHLALVVGDVTGHDMASAALMGRLRSKLRLLLVDRHEPPAASLRRLDTANQALGDRITATAVLAHLKPAPSGEQYQLTWCNAGHPVPLLYRDGVVTPLSGRDPLLGVSRRTPRTSHVLALEPGATVLFYTDGLIETRTRTLDEREEELYAALARHGCAPLPELLDRLYTEIAGTEHEDDVAMLAVRIPAS